MTETLTIPVPDVDFNEIASTATTMRASKEGITIVLGFVDFTIPWCECQIWDFVGYNPVQRYRGAYQYNLAFSSGDIKGTNIRCFASKLKLMFNVPKAMFEYVAKCRGMEAKVATWEATATEYKPASNNDSSDDSASDASEAF